MTNQIGNNWWLLQLRGVLFLVFGIIAMAAWVVILFNISLFIGIIILVTGIVLFFEGLSDNDNSVPWLRIIEGLISVIFSLLVFINSAHTYQLTIHILALWMVVVGVLHLISSVITRKIINEWFGIFNALIMLAFGALLLSNLITVIHTIINIIAIFYILLGLFTVLQSLKLRQAENG